MPDINDLWDSQDEQEWLAALDRGWLNQAGRKNRELAQSIHTVDMEYVLRLGIQEWYDFLNKYFHWQFARNHLQQKLSDLDGNSFEHLFSVKCSLGEIEELDLADARKCLNLVRSPRIKGLDYASASGLLALLFKQWFGTVDICVLESLCKIKSLPERRKMKEISAWVKTKNEWRESDAVLIIYIMRRKAAQLNGWFRTENWTPSSVSMILSTFNRSIGRGQSCMESARPARRQRL